jgi:large subunit ribosomal protein L17
MKKQVFGRQLSRERDTRRALFRGIVISLIENGKINTTKAKAKAVIPLVDKLVNLSKDGSQASLRKAYGLLGNKSKYSRKLIEEIGPTFPDRRSGYTRIINLGTRRGDKAKMVRLEWVKEIVKKEEKKAKSKKTVTKRKTARPKKTEKKK